MLITCSQNLHTSPLIGYALNFEVLIRQITLGGGNGFFLALYVIVSCSPSKQMGLDISALLKRCIVSGTGSTGYIECVSMVAMSGVDNNPLGLLSQHHNCRL